MTENNQKVKITFLGGVGEIGKNMTAIEYGDDMIVVDYFLSLLFSLFLHTKTCTP